MNKWFISLSVVLMCLVSTSSCKKERRDIDISELYRGATEVKTLNSELKEVNEKKNEAQAILEWALESHFRINPSSIVLEKGSYGEIVSGNFGSIVKANNINSPQLELYALTQNLFPKEISVGIEYSPGEKIKNTDWFWFSTQTSLTAYEYFRNACRNSPVEAISEDNYRYAGERYYKELIVPCVIQAAILEKIVVGNFHEINKDVEAAFAENELVPNRDVVANAWERVWILLERLEENYQEYVVEQNSINQKTLTLEDSIRIIREAGDSIAFNWINQTIWRSTALKELKTWLKDHIEQYGGSVKGD